MLDQVAEVAWVRQHTHTAHSELIRSLGDLDEVLGDRLLGRRPTALGLPVPTGRVSNTRPAPTRGDSAAIRDALLPDDRATFDTAYQDALGAAVSATIIRSMPTSPVFRDRVTGGMSAVIRF